jgi:hypothetical protein
LEEGTAAPQHDRGSKDELEPDKTTRRQDLRDGPARIISDIANTNTGTVKARLNQKRQSYRGVLD